MDENKAAHWSGMRFELTAEGKEQAKWCIDKLKAIAEKAEQSAEFGNAIAAISMLSSIAREL